MEKQNIQAKRVYWLRKGGGAQAVAHYVLAFGYVINPLFLFRSIVFFNGWIYEYRSFYLYLLTDLDFLWFHKTHGIVKRSLVNILTLAEKNILELSIKPFYRAFLLFFFRKRMFLYKKMVHSYRISLEHQYDSLFGTPIWRTWRHIKNALECQLVTYPGPGPPSPRLKTCLGLSKYWNLCSNLEIQKKVHRLEIKISNRKTTIKGI